MIRPVQPSEKRTRRACALALGTLLLGAAVANAAAEPQLIENPGAYAAAAGAVGAPAASPWHAFSILLAGDQPEINFWTLEAPLSSPGRRIWIGASTLVLGGLDPHPLNAALTDLAVLRTGEHLHCWSLVNPEKVRPIPPALLARVRDRRSTPTAASGDPELDAYARFLEYANQTSDAAFRKAAEELNRNLAINAPQECRGNVYRIEGKLGRLREVKPDRLAREAGVGRLYEAWIFQKEYGPKHPTCVLFTHLPKDLAPAEKFEDTNVQFAGYFYKLYRYESADPEKPFKFTPLLIGHSLDVLAPPVAPESDRNVLRDLAPWFLALVAVVIGSLLGVTLWYRYSDEKVRRRIAQARQQEFVLPPPEEPPSKAEPPAESGAPSGG